MMLSDNRAGWLSLEIGNHVLAPLGGHKTERGRNMLWPVVNLLAFVGTPVGLLYGWITYRRETRLRPGPRLRISQAGLLAASCSVLALAISFVLPRSAEVLQRYLSRAGMLLPMVGTTLSLAGRGRLIPLIVLACIGALMLWYGLSLP